MSIVKRENISIVNRGKLSIFTNAYSLADVGVSNYNTLILIICEIESRRLDTNFYYLDTNWTQVVARKKEGMKFS